MDTTKSKVITQAYLNQSDKLNRFQTEFSGTWKTSMDDFFPLLCPAREADWIPGWTAEILYSEREGLASKNCIFRTDETNTAWGPGLWYFVGYEKNKFIDVIRFKTNSTMRLRIDAEENGDGTITAVWHITADAITTAGNEEISELEDKFKMASEGLPQLIGYYLDKGTMISM